MKGTFYWHDYETFGIDPSRDRAVQFAGIRTDGEFNIIGEPLVIYSKPASDVLPQPGACLVTGITPQVAREKGLPECEFIEKIHQQLAEPGTCTSGYNTIRFDDEVTRYTLYRNFYDPYTREWQNGNSRWDIIDMVRTTYALRPEGIEWPLREDGLPSFKLEHLTAANDIDHGAAHDALSDVHATIAMARLVRERQPRLFDYLLTHRDKRKAMSLLDIAHMKPVLHVSGMFSAERSCTALIVPLVQHPSNKNEVICYDLEVDPQPLIDMDVDGLRERLYMRNDELPEGMKRLGLTTVKLNRCPVLVTAKMLDRPTAERLHINVTQCREYRQKLQQINGLKKKLVEIYSGRVLPEITNPDRMLYGGGFFSGKDKSVMDQVRAASPDKLREQTFVFEDARLPEMLFRYRARNYPESLTAEEMKNWQEFCFQHLTDPKFDASICMDQYLQEIEQLKAREDLSAQQRKVLDSLLEYSDELLG